MFIRYFATNRNRENLGRNIERDKRLQLQSGGYHWLNMNKYMSHYLGTTDSSSCPKEVYVLDSKVVVFEKFLKKGSIKRIMICVHGYNVELHQAHTWFNIFCKTLTYTSRNNDALKNILITDPEETTQAKLLADDSNDLTAVVGFSWPSNGNLISYQNDRTEALSSRTALANMIGRIKDLCPNKELILVAHSMGNLLSCSMLASIVSQEFAIPDFKDMPDYRDSFEKNKKEKFIDKYIMIAADIERRQITQCDIEENVKKEEGKSFYLGTFFPGLKYAVGEVHNFYSRFDNALLASNTEKGFREKIENVKEFFTGTTQESLYEQRLGLTEHPKAIAPENIKSHNGVALSNRELDHSDYQDCLPVMEEIAKIILK